MQKKYITCIHDKKADTFDGFMMFNNIAQAVRSFQQGCDQIDSFKRWPEDYQLILVAEISYEDGDINEKGEIMKEAKFLPFKEHKIVIAEAKDYVAIQKAKNEKNTK